MLVNSRATDPCYGEALEAKLEHEDLSRNDRASPPELRPLASGSLPHSAADGRNAARKAWTMIYDIARDVAVFGATLCLVIGLHVCTAAWNRAVARRQARADAVRFGRGD